MTRIVGFSDLFAEKLREPVYVLLDRIKEDRKDEAPSDWVWFGWNPITILGTPLSRINGHTFERIPTNIYITRDAHAWKRMLQIDDIKDVLGEIAEIYGLNAQLKVSDFGSIYYSTWFTRKRSMIRAQIIKNGKVETNADVENAQRILNGIRDEALGEKCRYEKKQETQGVIDAWCLLRESNVEGSRVEARAQYLSHEPFYRNLVANLPVYAKVVYLGSLFSSSDEKESLYCHLLERESSERFKIVHHPKSHVEAKYDPIVVVLQVPKSRLYQLLEQGLTTSRVIRLDKLKSKPKFSTQSSRPYFRLASLERNQEIEVKVLGKASVSER